MTKRVALGVAIALGTGITLAGLVPVVTPSGTSTADEPARTSPPAVHLAAPAEMNEAPPAVARTAVAGVVTPASREVTVPAGTRLYLELEQAVASDTSRVEQRVRASLARPLVVGGRTVVPAGSAVDGVVTQARRSGKVKGRAYLAMRFTSLAPLGHDDRYRLRTQVWARQARGTKKDDAVKIGVPAGAGAAIGAIAGGKKGAGVGAAVGGGAGTAVVLATRGEEVRLGPGARVIVRLAEPLKVRVTT